MFHRIDQFFRIVLTEWKMFFRDPACFLVIVVGVLLYAFYYPYPYVHEIVNKAPAAIVDEDHSAVSRQIIRMASTMQEDTLVAIYDKEIDAQRALADETIYCYMKIPEGMEPSDFSIDNYRDISGINAEKTIPEPEIDIDDIDEVMSMGGR